ncbi:MAG: Eco57I restriction-modification methylase domain-containing protein, partial [Christensenellaceae bacterium]|nr:Eco57I restriction-modification methylase domain-containing protein [Christensenellaceae bacterium]
MNFNIVVGNPPYQVVDGGAGASSIPIYNLFIEISQKVSSELVSIISPARWMIGGKGLDDFRMKMLNDNHFMRLTNFTNSFDVFDGVDIMGGISFFTWDKLLEKKCHIITHNSNGQIENTERFLSEDGFNTFVRNEMCLEIYNKIKDKYTESFSQLVAKQKPYGLRTDFFKDPKKYGLPNISESPINDGYSILG